MQGTHLQSWNPRLGAFSQDFSPSLRLTIRPMSTYSHEAREIELSGLKHLQDFYGRNATVKDLAHTSGHDFEIIHSNNHLGIGDITWLENPLKRSLSKAISKKANPYFVNLKAGSGFWSVSLEDHADVNRIYRELADLVQKMIALDTFYYENLDTSRKDEIAQDCRYLGIARIRYANSSTPDTPDQAYVRPKGGGGSVPSDYSRLAKEIEELLRGQVKSSWTKLINKPAEEKHLYLRLGSLIPLLSAEALWIEVPPAEICDISFPEGISHIWLEGGGQERRNILWRRDDENVFF